MPMAKEVDEMFQKSLKPDVQKVFVPRKDKINEILATRIYKHVEFNNYVGTSI